MGELVHTKRMPNPPAAEAATLPPAAIADAIARVATLPDLIPAHARALCELLRCVSARDPARPLRVSVAHLCERMRRSRNTVGRYLAALESAGWIARHQVTRGARRWGWRVAVTRLTDAALQALGLVQRAPSVAPVSKPYGDQAPPRRAHRLPADLRALGERIGAGRVVWLMARARAAGRRLQDVLTPDVLYAESPCGLLLRRLAGKRPENGSSRPETSTGGAERRPAAEVFAEQDAGARTIAGRLAGLAALRAWRGR